MTDERYKITCRLCDKTSEVPAPDPDEPAFLNCPHCGGRFEIRWREPMTVEDAGAADLAADLKAADDPSAPFLGTTDPEPAPAPAPAKKNGGKKAIMAALALLALLPIMKAQDPPPCSPESPMHTDYYPPENGNCQPCFAGYYVTWDTNYGIACDAGCDPVRYDVCAPDRQVIQTQLFGCHYDGNACPSVQFPYLCQLETIVYDYCTNQTCGPYTLSAPFCNDRLSSIKTESRPSGIQVACGGAPRLDRFGPRVNAQKEPGLPWGVLLRKRYQVLLTQARPGAKCTFTKAYRKYHKMT